jgi:hypothetical protein
MKKNIIITALSLIVIMFFASCKNKSSESNAVQTATEQTENTKYQCPMKCEGKKLYDKPGQCPECKMDLVKIEGIPVHQKHDTTNAKH